jgi:uncharacterized protein (DUF305 family)
VKHGSVSLSVVVPAAILIVLAGCGGAPPAADAPGSAPVVQPGAPGQATTTRPAAARAAGPAAPAAHAADIAFMQGMIHHHLQALEMTALLRTRTAREDMKLLAQRIDVSQTDEIRMMRTWLTDRGLTVEVDHIAHGREMAMMPGMLSREQMAALEKARGAEFDRLFLAGMIQHHEGALVMVEELFRTPGAGQESVIFDFASHVDVDQKMEISRMRRMLATDKR